MEQINWDEYTKNKKSTSFPINLLEKYSKGNILDLGCGDGTHAKIIYDLKVGNVYGIDASSYIIGKAKKMHPGINFKQGSAYNLPYKDNFFDLIYSIDLIEHLKEPQMMLGEVKRVLRPGGIFIIQTPNYPVKRIYDFYNVIAKNVWRKKFADDPTHLYKFNALGLRKMCSKNFKVVDFKARNIFAEKKVKFLKRLKDRGNMITILFGQKTIIVLKK